MPENEEVTEEEFEDVELASDIDSWIDDMLTGPVDLDW